MAYYGTTASSSLVNPPRCITNTIGQLGSATGLSTTQNTQRQQGGNVWYYTSTNKTTDIFVSNFFTDGKTLGMRPGDILMGAQYSSAGSSVVLTLGVVTGVSTSGATLSTGASLTSTHA